MSINTSIDAKSNLLKLRRKKTINLYNILSFTEDLRAVLLWGQLLFHMDGVNFLNHSIKIVGSIMQESRFEVGLGCGSEVAMWVTTSSVLAFLTGCWW